MEWLFAVNSVANILYSITCGLYLALFIPSFSAWVLAPESRPKGPSLRSLVMDQERMTLVGEFAWFGPVLWVYYSAFTLIGDKKGSILCWERYPRRNRMMQIHSENDRNGDHFLHLDVLGVIIIWPYATCMHSMSHTKQNDVFCLESDVKPYLSCMHCFCIIQTMWLLWMLSIAFVRIFVKIYV